MARKFKELSDALDAKLTPKQRAASKAWVETELEKIRLNEVRRARKMTQVALAKKLGIEQSAVSRIESQADVYLSTLRSYIEGTGGRLEVRAVYPDHTMTLEVGE